MGRKKKTEITAAESNDIDFPFPAFPWKLFSWDTIYTRNNFRLGNQKER